MNYASILLQVLNLAVVGSLTYERAKALEATMKTIIAENRDPTDAEWADLQASGIEAADRLDAAAAKL